MAKKNLCLVCQVTPSSSQVLDWSTKPCCGRKPGWLSFSDECPKSIFFQLPKLNKYWSGGWTSSCAPGTPRFSKAPITNGPVKLLLFTCNCRGLKRFAANMIKLSVSETQWSSLLARTRALIRYISIWIFDFGPEKLPGLSRNRPQVIKKAQNGSSVGLHAVSHFAPQRLQNVIKNQKGHESYWNSEYMYSTEK